MVNHAFDPNSFSVPKFEKNAWLKDVLRCSNVLVDMKGNHNFAFVVKSFCVQEQFCKTIKNCYVFFVSKKSKSDYISLIYAKYNALGVSLNKTRKPGYARPNWQSPYPHFNFQ